MIRLENINVTFGKGTETEVRALDIPALELFEGSWNNVIGPNGSGKSTLLKVICGQILSLEGKIFITGKNITGSGASKRFDYVQMIEQDPRNNTVASMTIEENLRLYAFRRGSPALSFLKSGSVAEIRELLARFDMGLEDRLHSQAGLLSGGQRQAVAVAAVLLRNPKILLLDEFTAAIDPKTAPKLLNIVKQLAADFKITVIMVSHDLEQVINSGDRIFILSSGKVAEDIATAAAKITKAELVAKYTRVLEEEGVL